MNQQRARRFRAAQEASVKAAEKRRQLERAKSNNEFIVDCDEGEPFDSNAITPGTPFMANLRLALEYYILQKLAHDPGWKEIQVILSDASVPGEGEHKIMRYIRHQKESEFHNPYTMHVIYGLDADLIMLALATHEPNFMVLREDVFYKESLKKKQCTRCGKPNHTASKCFLTSSEAAESLRFASQHPFLFLDIGKLRDHLRSEFSQVVKTFQLSFERIIDDWIFLIFFVGNDFLPHLPSLEIREGAIDRLVKIYKEEFLIKRTPLTWDDPDREACYLTKSGHVNLTAVRMIMEQIGQCEDEIFMQRKEREDRENSKKSARSSTWGANLSQHYNRGEFRPVQFVPAANNIISTKPVTLASIQQPLNIKSREEAIECKLKNILHFPETQQSQLAKGKEELQSIEHLLKSVLGLSIEDKSSLINTQESPLVNDVLHPLENLEEEEEALLQDVCLWLPGYKKRYYSLKFGVDTDEDQLILRKTMSEHYMQGCAWVLQYYYCGCPSWDWFYPYHYAPFASDFSLSQMVRSFPFQQGTPFKPFEQLLSVLPAASSELLPAPFARMMRDKDSEIIDFYPLDFSVDLNGAKQPWKAVILLPFIDAPRLLKAAQQATPLLNAEERPRNCFGEEMIFVTTKHPLAGLISKLSPNLPVKTISTSTMMKPSQISEKGNSSGYVWMNPAKYHGSDGALGFNVDSLPPGSYYACQLEDLRVPPVQSTKSWSASYRIPFEHKKLVFKVSEFLKNKAYNPKFVNSGTNRKRGEKKSVALQELAKSMAPQCASTTRGPIDYRLLTKDSQQ